MNDRAGGSETSSDIKDTVALSSEAAVWQRNARRSNLLTIAFIVVIVVWMFLATWFEPWTPQRVAGLVLFVVAATLVVVARVQLGASFTGAAEARSLVTRGLYSRLQNPIYLFAMFAVTGLILFLNKPWYFLCFLVVIPVQTARVRRERNVLMEAFGERYAQYRKSTWF